MTKSKKIKLSEINENSTIISNKKPVFFDYILIFFIAVPFIILIFFGNVDIKSSNSSNQDLTNSWQKVSPAFSNESEAPKVAPSRDKIIPTFPLNTYGKLQ
jgi:hypothetical protein